MAQFSSFPWIPGGFVTLQPGRLRTPYFSPARRFPFASEPGDHLQEYGQGQA